MALFDQIKQNLQQAASPLGQPIQSNQEQIQTVLGAKTGKDLSGTGTPRASNQQERSVQDQTRLGLKQLGQQAAIAEQRISQQQSQQEEEQKIQGQAISEEVQAIRQNYQLKAKEILGDLERGQEQISFRRQKAKFEQLGFNLRLSTEQYTDKLEREGAMARLDDEAFFEESLARAIFAEEEDLFRESLDFKALLNADQREFEKELSAIDLEFAMDMAKQSINQANQTMMWTSAGSMVTAGVNAWEKAGTKKTPNEDIDASNNDGVLA